MTRGKHSRIDTVVLDLDGTLVDSVYQHVLAWQVAFHEVGLRVSATDLHQAIGMGGDRLVAQVAGEAAEGAVGDVVRQAHAQHFHDLLPHVHETRGASELIAELSTRNQVVVASSGDRESTEELLSAVAAAHLLTVVISGSDVDHSKPAPDPVEAAMEAAHSRRVIVIGDSVWDHRSAQSAGVPSIGLLCGGIGEDALLAAGAGSVHANPATLLAHLGRTPLAPAGQPGKDSTQRVGPAPP